MWCNETDSLIGLLAFFAINSFLLVDTTDTSMLGGDARPSPIVSSSYLASDERYGWTRRCARQVHRKTLTCATRCERNLILAKF